LRNCLVRRLREAAARCGCSARRLKLNEVIDLVVREVEVSTSRVDHKFRCFLLNLAGSFADDLDVVAAVAILAQV
jgi:hypothetical protein